MIVYFGSFLKMIKFAYIFGPILQAYPFCENSTPEKKKKKKPIFLGYLLFPTEM
jgi:hypothetical protein